MLFCYHAVVLLVVSFVVIPLEKPESMNSSKVPSITASILVTSCSRMDSHALCGAASGRLAGGHSRTRPPRCRMHVVVSGGKECPLLATLAEDVVDGCVPPACCF